MATPVLSAEHEELLILATEAVVDVPNGVLRGQAVNGAGDDKSRHRDPV